MKSVTRTVLNGTLAAVTSYSSGPLDVGDLFELAIDFACTASSGGTWTFNISRIGADGNLYLLRNVVVSLSGSGHTSLDLGAGLAPDLNNVSYVAYSFGDQVQVDAVSPNPGVATISTTISIKGKG